MSKPVARHLWLALAALLVCAVASAEPMTPDQRFEGPKTLEIASVRASFALPAGFVGVMPSGSEFGVIGKDDEMGRVFLWAASASKEQVHATMTQGFVVADAVQLTPTAAPTSNGAELSGAYQAFDGTNSYQAHVYALTDPSGGAIAFIAVAPADTFAKYNELARKLAKSVKFGVTSKPAVGGPKGDGGNSGPWAAQLANTQFVRYAHGSDYSEKETYNLCGSGRFYHFFGASSAGPTGTGGLNDKDQGSWSVAGSQLTLRFDNGNTSTVTISEQGGSFYVDGVKWYRVPNPCQ